jgi:hypothetical protein
MDTKNHITKSFDRLYQENPRYFLDQWQILRKLVWELHSWFDAYNCTKGYNSVYTIYYHREVRHHWEGIDQCVIFFTSRYGLQYGHIILAEAKTHVQDDFGEIPSQSEVTRHYLRKKRGW